ncbi:MAG: hypothetical protein QM820_56985 [Minicystis sp.]
MPNINSVVTVVNKVTASETDDLDLTLRHVTRRFPVEMAQALLPPGAVITSARWVDTQLAGRQCRLDRAIEVTAGSVVRLEHTEWQVEMTADMPYRLYEYNALTAFALAGEAVSGEPPPRLQSTLVLLSGRDKPWPEHGTYRTSPDDQPFSGLTYRIEAVYQRTVAELEARGPLWAIFAPLAVDADPARMKDVLDRLRATQPLPRFGELAVALSVIAAKDKRQRGLHEVILSMLSKEEAMQSPVYAMGQEDGKQSGREETVVQLYELRLGRALSDAEHTTLVQRLERLGTARLLGVPCELSSDALAAWLADPAAA